MSIGVCCVNKMRIRASRICVILVFVLNAILLFLTFKLIGTFSGATDYLPTDHAHIVDLSSVSETVEEQITVVIREFEPFENDIIGTVESFLSVFPNLRVLVVSDALPYPPIIWRTSNVSANHVDIISLKLDMFNPPSKSDPLSFVFTKYILFVPDSTRIRSDAIIRSMILEVQKKPSYIVTAVVSDSRVVECLKLNLNLREWLIEYSSGESDICDSLHGKHAVLVATEIVKKLPAVFMLPFPEALFIQTAAQNIQVKLLRRDGFTEGRPLFKSTRANWKWQQLHKQRLKEMFAAFGIKKVVRESGDVEWYGCNRNTARCFGTVVDDTPQYLWEGKWTPPCCLSGLRRTARHVFAHLDESGVRYWLEGGSLLGAVRSSDILPWDYDVDVGFFREDIPKCLWLERAQKQPVVDSNGFLWEKAQEGDFFRVQYSQSNHLHVDLFPFYEVNGTMTKDTWFPTHKQDRKFPKYYLHPMSTITFIGRQVPAPNNIRDFLEFKFGKNVIENPEYPNPSQLKFPSLKNYLHK